MIWFLWLQGIDKAPIEVRKCYESWVQFNPGWQVVFLNEANIHEHLALENTGLTHQAFSDFMRINLLAKNGGVWVDATCFCVKPLDEWLPAHMTQGFFAFDKPAPDRMLSSWFLASYKYNYITATYAQNVNAFWKENKGVRLIENTRWNFIYERLLKYDTKIWFNPIITKILRVYPYFWFHYTFQYIYLRDANFREIWDAVPKISADIPHRLLFAGVTNPVTEEIKSEIAAKVSPVYKLTWKYDAAQYKQGTIMEYLFNRDK